MHKKELNLVFAQSWRDCLCACASDVCVCVCVCVCVRFRCVCVCVCALQMCVCVCVCALQMCACACASDVCVCVRASDVCVCARASDVCVYERFKCVCVRALQMCVWETSHTARDCSANNPERLLCSPRAFGLLISSLDTWDWTRMHVLAVMHRRTLCENVDRAKIKVPFLYYRYRYFTHGIVSSYIVSIHIDESLHPYSPHHH